MASGKAISVDAQRVVAIMEELTEKLTYLSVVTRQVLEGLQGDEGDKATNLLGPELARKLADQIRLEELYQGNSNSANEGSMVTLDTEDIQEITEQLEKNTRDICRRMCLIPNVVQELRAFQETRPVNSMKLIHALADMQEVMVKRMTMTVEEERARQELLERYIQQEKCASLRRAELEKQLTFLRTEREKASSRSSEMIVKLKADLQDVLDFTEQRLAQLYDQYGKREAEHTQNFEMRATELRSRISQQRKHNSAIFASGKEETDNLKSRKKIAEKDVERVIKAYDREMFEKEAKISEVKAKNQANKDLVEQLQGAVQMIDEEAERIRQEQNIEKARQAISQANLQRLSAAATLLQAYWRGLRQREEYIAMKKSARGKKGKKGKGKKK